MWVNKHWGFFILSKNANINSNSFAIGSFWNFEKEKHIDLNINSCCYNSKLFTRKKSGFNKAESIHESELRILEQSKLSQTPEDSLNCRPEVNPKQR